MIRTAILALLALACALPAAAATLAATPATFVAIWAKAACGDTVVLGAGEYGPAVGSARPLDLAGKACAGRPVTIDAAKATLVNVRMGKVQGLALRGGMAKPRHNGVGWTPALTFEGSAGKDGAPAWDCGGILVSGLKVVGPFRAEAGMAYQPGAGHGVSFLRCRGVEVSDTLITGVARGALFGLSADVIFDRNTCQYVSSDCLNLGQVWGAKVRGNIAHASIVSPGEHPDFVQSFSRAFYPGSLTPAPPSGDFEITDNICVGATQCIFLGNKSRAYSDGKTYNDGGFDGVSIGRNLTVMSGGSAIGLEGVRGLRLWDNRVQTLAGAPFGANINIRGSSDITRCGNAVAAAPRLAGVSDAAC